MSKGIYQIRNIKNNKIYVGSSINLASRKYSHFLNLRNNNHNNSHLQRAYNKYGADNFVWEVIEICEGCTREFLIEREQYYIDLYMLCNPNNGYNMNPVANSVIHTEDSRRKLKVTNRGRVPVNKGVPMSEEQKKKISSALTGKKLSEEHREKCRHAHDNYVSKPVLNITTGEEFKSVREASEHYSIRQNHLREVCYGNRESCGGFRWKFLPKPKMIEKSKEKKVRGKKPIPVINVTLNREFRDASQASEYYNIDRGHILDSCNKTRATAGGYQWRWKDHDVYPSMSEETREKLRSINIGKTPWNKGKPLTEEHRRKIGESNAGAIVPEERRRAISKACKREIKKLVLNITTGEKFGSAREASEIYGLRENHIREVCNGHRSTTGGFRWEYIT